MSNRLVIIGSGPAGLAAAKAFRDNGGVGEVVILSEDTVLPYERPPLSKDFLRGTTGDDDLGIEVPGFYAEQAVEVRLGVKVTGLDVRDRVVRLADGDPLEFSTCVLATGATPAVLPVPGVEHPAVHTLRSLADARRLIGSAADAARATVIGSGFIGCEVAASLARRGVEVTLVSDETVPQEARLGADAGAQITSWLRSEGCRLVLGDAVAEIKDGTDVVLPDGRQLPGDLVVVAGGIKPRAELAEGAGLQIEKGRIQTDERMQTSVPGIYAAGDVVIARNAKAGRRLAVEHWGEALAMGEVAGTNAAGGDAQWDQAPGFWSTIGDHTLKYVAWGDGYDESRMVEHGGGAFTVWYGADGVVVGALTHEADDDYERGGELVESAAAMTEALGQSPATPASRPGSSG